MANFAVAASLETIEKANSIMELYSQEGDKKEDTLLRILSVAEKESVRGTHPALESSLRSVDSTISTLIKQINGIVAGQDTQIQELKEKLEKAIEEKRTAIDTASAQIEAAKAKSDAADAAIAQAQEKIVAAETQANEEIQSAKKDAAIEIERANTERDQALRERDDARTISAEKSASNDLLMRQMASMEADAQAYKDLQDSYAQLSEDLSSAHNQLADKERELSALTKDFETDRKTMESDFTRRMVTANAQEELAVEKAVIARERELRKEYQDQIRQSDQENAKLQAKIEQLQAELNQLTNLKESAL